MDPQSEGQSAMGFSVSAGRINLLDAPVQAECHSMASDSLLQTARCTTLAATAN
jgi:hypothetical protein